MKLTRLILLGLIVSSLVFANACKKQKDDTARTLGMLGMLSTAPCMGCHSADTELGQKIKFAQSGWEESHHANGGQSTIYKVNGGVCVDTGYATKTACAAAVGTWDSTNSRCTKTSPTTGVALNATSCAGLAVGVTTTTCSGVGACQWVNTWNIAGFEWEGSNAPYANAQLCQTCHTSEGFKKRITGVYGTEDTETTDAAAKKAYYVARLNDYITDPSPIECFTCHNPHAKGSMDRVVADGTTVTTMVGGVYKKKEGNICVKCHQVRPTLTANVPTGTSAAFDSGLNCINYASDKSNITEFTQYFYQCNDVNSLVVMNVRLGAFASPHDQPAGDVMLGSGGAEFTNNSAIGNMSYSKQSSTHAKSADAGCTVCHFTINDDGNRSRLAGSPNVGGHSFNVVGLAHGTETANNDGCTGSGCHTAVALGALPANMDVFPTMIGTTANNNTSVKWSTLAASNKLTSLDAYLHKGAPTDPQLYDKVNTLLGYLANPNDFTLGTALPTNAGLLSRAFNTLAGSTNKINIGGTYPDGSFNPKYSASLSAPTATYSAATGSPKLSLAAWGDTSANDDSNKKVLLAKAYYNYQLVVNDMSYGHHNPTYVQQLLWDSCAALHYIIDGGTTCTEAVNNTTLWSGRP